MARKNIFQLVDESYDIQNEIMKICTLFESEYYFCMEYENYTFESLVAEELFYDWKHRGTCVTVTEYLKRAQAEITSNTLRWTDIPEETIINYLEVLENFIALLNNKMEYLSEEYGCTCYSTFNSVFIDLINTLEKKLGLTTRTMDGRVLLYPENATLEKAIESCEDEDVQWEMIRYVREKLGLSEKRKVLTELGNHIEPILKSRALQKAGYNQLESDVGFMLNSFHVRHNNKVGAKAQDYIVSLNDTQLEEWYDKLYNAILAVIIINDHIPTQTGIESLKKTYNWRS